MVNTTKTKRVKEEKEELLHALETKVTEFTILHQIAQTATESLELDQVLNNCLDKVIQLMGVETAAILLTKEQNGEVKHGCPWRGVNQIPGETKGTANQQWHRRQANLIRHARRGREYCQISPIS